ncbi:MAG: hypothetical protein AVDCRST_MAG68-3965 [uncultured Gemmatimonadetes bacterium]|uniref:Uncharacterized protein n=1 Tax=uncultured Gemmatimonadota bacterium TaxID=203437 RepID=A0A6J4M1N8_9BACT|nr:MAG: hypothetical protein AVDCRST_MAG68-3965 [uncultured Gemmatimonadota bacterium]
MKNKLRDEGGFIIFGALILIVVLLVVGVLLGKVLRKQYPDSYIEATAARHWLVTDAEMEMGGRTVGRLRQGDSVWATRLENGDVAITTDRAGRKVVGFVGSAALSAVRGN